MRTRPTENETLLLRRLLGESPASERAELERRLAVEPDLARELAALERCWRDLELPPAAPAPIGFASRVAARARQRRESEPGALRLRWASAAALVVGIALGTSISFGFAASSGESGDAEVEATLAESYLDAAESGDADAASGARESYDDLQEVEPEAEVAPR